VSTIVLPGINDIVPIRASGLAELFDCSERFKGKNFLGHRSPTYGRSHLGTAIHYATAWYDNERVLEDGDPDIETAIDKFTEYLRADEKVFWADIPKQKAESIGITLVNTYCQSISSNYDWIKVEATCEPLQIPMPNGIIFELTGHVDRVYRECVAPNLYKYGVADLKTSSRIVSADGTLAIDRHGLQLAIYELLEMQAAEATGLEMTLPALVIGFSTSGRLEILAEKIPNPRALLFGDGESEGYLIGASKIIEQQLYIGNTYSQLCSERYCASYNQCFYVNAGGRR
jgi:hypothetical protein